MIKQCNYCVYALFVVKFQNCDNKKWDSPYLSFIMLIDGQLIWKHSLRARCYCLFFLTFYDFLHDLHVCSDVIKSPFWGWKWQFLFMQVLSGSFLSSYGKDVINIHHGLLPSFKGGNPSRQVAFCASLMNSVAIPSLHLSLVPYTCLKCYLMFSGLWCWCEVNWCNKSLCNWRTWFRAYYRTNGDYSLILVKLIIVDIEC